MTTKHAVVGPWPHLHAARNAIEEARQSAFPMKHYTHIVMHQLPMLLHRHGLGQTLAYLQMRGGGNTKTPFELVARQMDRWLLQALEVSARGALAVLSAKDSRFYREASAQAWLFVRALRACLEESQ
jgi:hypothetical protein